MAASQDAFVTYKRLRQLDGQYQSPFPLDRWYALRVDQLRWQERLERLLEARRDASAERLRRGVEFAMRAAALDTGALEGLYEVEKGFTISVATQAVAWQAGLAAWGEPVRELFEAQLRAYELALDIATNSRAITEAWIRNLHEVLCAPQATLAVLSAQGPQFEKGEYKRFPNHVALPGGEYHVYAPVDRVSDEMHRLVAELSSPQFEQAHPVVQAAAAHYALAAIHPFQDGNGRVARALSSVFLYRAASVPLVVFADQQHSYLDALHQADEGDLQALLDFLVESVLDTMEIVQHQIQEPAEEVVAELQHVLTGPEGLSHQALMKVASAVMDLASEGFIAQVNSVINGDIEVQVGRTEMYAVESPLRGYWLSNPTPALSLAFMVRAPVSVSVGRSVVPVMRVDGQRPYALRLARLDTGEGLDVRLRDVQPRPTESFLLRLQSWIRRELSEGLRELQQQVVEAIDKQGRGIP